MNSELAARYNEPHRKYHNIKHIAYMFKTFKEHFDPRAAEEILLYEDGEYGPNTITGVGQYAGAIAVAIKYHDVVYEPEKGDQYNVSESVKLMWEEYPPTRKYLFHPEKVAKAIMNTTHHTISEQDEQDPIYCAIAGTLFDLDLWHLSDAEKLQETNKLIQQEYNATDEQWAIGRSQWLRKFLERDTIYNTSIGAERETIARRLLEDDLKELESRL